ncbi:MAG: HipA domain-containing protein [Bacteroidetes bacterium]|nr:HipA domain-containing protein [Bacteroidota bacterium]
MGILRSEKSRGEEVFSFEYSESWLKSKYAQEIDPDLKLLIGPQYITDEKPNFGLFLDSSPDRWGRMLMERREAILARKGETPQKRLTESDFLLGVNDETRMGALRFKLEEEGDFLSNQGDIKAPPFTSIRELEQASLRIEDDDFFKDEEAQKWMMMLMAPGSSLGGARPKASVSDPDGHLWIAKFPAKNDDKDIGAWEFLVNQMAHDLGLNVAVGDANIYSQKQHTFLTKRFDRTIHNERIHFASAMSLLGYKDGYNYKEGVSYLELVELIEQYGSDPNEDIRELWRRIVFSVAISNTDDHLRNHGFLLSKNGWKLSPAYDINPVEKGTGLSLNISENDNSLDFDLCIEVIDYFRWKEKEALDFINQTKKIVSEWKIRANRMNISHKEQVMMETAFER